MLDILKKFEDESTELDQPLDDQVDDEDDIVARLGDIDLEATSSEALWELLKPEERSRFLKALNDPKSELAQSLLTAQHRSAWWDDARRTTPSYWLSEAQDDGEMPKSLQIPAALLSASLNSTHPLPVWNLVAILYVPCPQSRTLYRHSTSTVWHTATQSNILLLLPSLPLHLMQRTFARPSRN